MKKVLVVDDTKNIRVLLSACLELRGYDVITAENGLIALDIIKDSKEAFDLIFLDIRMPGISGTEVLKKLREERINCPVIIMTAFATVKNAIDCTKLGAVVYLQKPFSPDRVNIVLDEIFKEKNNKDNYFGKEDVVDENENEIKDIFTQIDKLLIENKLEEAHESLKKLLSLDPYNKEIYLYISKVNNLMGNELEANRFYKIWNVFNE